MRNSIYNVLPTTVRIIIWNTFLYKTIQPNFPENITYIRSALQRTNFLCFLRSMQRFFNRECPRKCVQDETLQLCKLHINDLYSYGVLILRRHEKLCPTLASPHVVRALFSWKRQNVEHQICPPKVRKVYLSVRVIVQDFNCFLKW